MKKLGQHFLRNATILRTIIGALAIADGDRLIEIGPGHGELTLPIARAAQGKRCEIVCVEKDHTLAANLDALAREKTFGDEDRALKMKIVEGDALTLLPEIVSRLPRGAHYKIAGNIPYYITGKLLRVMSELERRPERAVLLIQKEVAERICATPPAMNRLAASVQFWAKAATIAAVPRKDFSPAPNVDSAVIVLENRVPAQNVDPEHYYRAVRALFAQPRKTLLNNLSAAARDALSKKGTVAGHLEDIGVDPAARPQDLGIEAIIAIAKAPLWG